MTPLATMQGRLVAVASRWAGRPTLVAVAAMNALTGLVVAAILVPLAFGQDAAQYRECGVAVAGGGGHFCGSLYPPITGLAARPLMWISPMAAGVVMTLLALAVLVAGVAVETRGLAALDRVLVGIAAVAFAPVVYELTLGQVTLLIAAALYPVVRRPDGFRNGILFGVALALAPKPLLLPILGWMLIWRRRALMSTLAVGLSLSAIGLVIVGPEQYREWFTLLTSVGRQSVGGNLELSLRGNFSLWPMTPTTFALACVVAAAALWTILRDCSRGFVASLFAALLLAPYTGLYAASILLLAVRPALAFAPRATRALALVANPVTAFLLALAAWSLGGLAASLPVGRGGNVRDPIERNP